MSKLISIIRLTFGRTLDSAVNAVLNSRPVALAAALIFSLVPLLGWVSLILVSLITLRRGGRAGLLMLLASSLPLWLALFNGLGMLVVYDFVFTAVMTWALSLLLRYTATWTIVIQVATLLSVALVALLHVVVPDLTGFWTSYLHQLQQSLSTQPEAMSPILQKLRMPLESDEILLAVAILSKFMTGLTVAFGVISVLMNIMMGRWMQSRVCHPGGFSLEMREARSDWLSLVVLAILCELAYLGSDVALDTVLVLLVPQCLLGLLVLHQLVANRPVKGVVLLGVYAGMLFSASLLPMVAILMLLVVADLIFDFRGKKNASHIVRKS